MKQGFSKQGVLNNRGSVVLADRVGISLRIPDIQLKRSRDTHRYTYEPEFTKQFWSR